uniref:DDE-1 domain-containing protein n=1 Tax=Electrophorus electricus TaxID=8005 RepID=A0AAY5EIJ8_ELEEL
MYLITDFGRKDNTTWGKKKKRKFMTRLKHGGVSIMVWGGFSYFGVGPIYRIPGTMDKSEYIKILEEVMLPYAEEMPLKLMFHTSKQATSWLQTNKIDVMKWPHIGEKKEQTLTAFLFLMSDRHWIIFNSFVFFT